MSKATKAIYGVIVIENINSNPNGDPDDSGKPRMSSDDRNIITGVSLNRKIRNHILYQTDTFLEVCEELGISKKEIDEKYNIYVEPENSASHYSTTYRENPNGFLDRFVDARLFGNTLLESENGNSENGNSEEEKVAKARLRPISGGPLSIGILESLNPAEVSTATLTRQQAMTEDKVGNGGIAPEGLKFVRYSLCTGRFSYSPDAAAFHRTQEKDLELYLKLLPHAYSMKAAGRPATEVIQIWSLRKPVSLPLSHSKFVKLVSPKYKDPENMEEVAKGREDYRFETKESVLEKLGEASKLELDVVDLV